MNDWRIFHGDGTRRDGVVIPPPPPWRNFQKSVEHRGKTYQAGEDEIRMVNAALYLRRPLLITGAPGSGKSSLPYAVAEELQLGPVLRWSINSRSTLTEGLYRYDALARLRDASMVQSRIVGASPSGRGLEPVESDGTNMLDIGHYLSLGPLGTALSPRDRPRVLLIDEIDKSDIDLPNDLLHVFEEGWFEIPELMRCATQQPVVTVATADGTDDANKVVIQNGRVTAKEFPFVVITSNGERELPPAFLRRCLRLENVPSNSEKLHRIVRAHLGLVDGAIVDELIEQYLQGEREDQLLAIDQLLNAVFLISSERAPHGEDRELVRQSLLRALNEE